jgi:transposase, IS5 family
MHQQTFASNDFCAVSARPRVARRSWRRWSGSCLGLKLCRLIEPVYPKGDGAGLPPVGLSGCCGYIFCLVNRSDPAVEEALSDAQAMRAFVGIDLGRKPAPDETAVCKCRHLLEAHDLGERLFAAVGE